MSANYGRIYSDAPETTGTHPEFVPPPLPSATSKVEVNVSDNRTSNDDLLKMATTAIRYAYPHLKGNAFPYFGVEVGMITKLMALVS